MTDFEQVPALISIPKGTIVSGAQGWDVAGADGGDSSDSSTASPRQERRLLLRIEEAAERLQIGRTKMYELVSRGDIESVPIGRLRRIPSECLEEYVERLRQSTDGARPTPAA